MNVALYTLVLFVLVQLANVKKKKQKVNCFKREE